ncbi:MAG: LysR family transcriptional regulator [Pseudomonadota bacterium]
MHINTHRWVKIGMEWDDLKYVLAVARSGSFLGAGHMLKVTHTTVGRRIRSLERDLGQPLFKRTRDGAEPTETCRRILPTAEEIEQQIRHISLTAMSEKVEPEGPVRIHTAAWIIEYVLIPKVPGFQAAYPKVQLFFVGDVVDTVVDTATPALSLRFDVMAKRNEIEAEVAEFPFSVYHRRDCDPDALPWASTSGGQVRLRTAAWLEKSGVSYEQVGVFADDAQLVRAALKTGGFKGMIPELLGEADPDLTRLTDGPPDLVRKLRTITPRRIRANSEVQAVLGWLGNTLQPFGA